MPILCITCGEEWRNQELVTTSPQFNYRQQDHTLDHCPGCEFNWHLEAITTALLGTVYASASTDQEAFSEEWYKAAFEAMEANP